MKQKAKWVMFILSFFFLSNIYADNSSDLIVAAFNGDIDKVRQLIRQGVNVNVKNEFGTTALQQAVVRNHIKVIELLIEKGANVNTKDNEGNTILIWAAAIGEKRVIELLLESGADRHAKNDRGITALMLADSASNKDALALLADRRTNTPFEPQHIEYLSALIVKTNGCPVEKIYVIPIETREIKQERFILDNLAAQCSYKARYPDNLLLLKPSRWEDKINTFGFSEKYSDNIIYEFWPDSPGVIECIGFTGKEVTCLKKRK